MATPVTKKWYQSKTILIGILTTLAGIIPLVMELINGKVIDAASVLVVVLGVIQVVRRVWLESPPALIK